MNLTGALPGSPEYLDVNNWLVIHNSTAFHSCQGFSTIKNLSNVKNQFADYGAEMLGDVDRFQRIIQRTRKFGGGNGVIPEQFQTMKTFDHVTYTLKNETFFPPKNI